VTHRSQRLIAAVTLAAAALAAQAEPLKEPPGGGAGVPAPGGALKVEGHVYDDTVVVAQAPLRLNGAGVRSQLWLKAFTAGLYLQQPATQAGSALAQPGAKRLRLRMLMDLQAEDFARALRRGVDKNHSPAEQVPLSDRLARLGQLVQSLGNLRNGDAVDLDYQPGAGLVLSLNGTRRGDALPGEDLYRALLRIFIGERPAQAALKNALLRGTPH
jgi:hypothetical protein